MKKIFSAFLILNLAIASVFAQSDDDFFFDDAGIDEITNVSASSDLSKGVLFENGSVKIGGSLSASIATTTNLYSPANNSFSDNLADTTLTPTLKSTLSVDARPTQDLRMYTKFAFNYPYQTVGFSLLGKVMISDYLQLKECFTDFSVADSVNFRFGVHTVTWGTGYFFSPISDIINTSSIDPENTDLQVDGCLNLRAQITFPDSQNCLWLYAIPSEDFKANKTALAAKYEFVIGGWEFGTGAYYRYQAAPKAVLTATGSLEKISFFGEAVYQYGADSEWTSDSSWSGKTNIFKATAGFSYYWKEPKITLAGQYYYDGNSIDGININYLGMNLSIPSSTKGHNVAAMANFGKIAGSEDFSIALFAMVNFGKDDITEPLKTQLEQNGMSIPSAIFSATGTYSVNSNLKFGLGPYITVSDWDEKPTVALKLNATLGGGKY